jgi:hypothetical protein
MADPSSTDGGAGRTRHVLDVDDLGSEGVPAEEAR